MPFFCRARRSLLPSLSSPLLERPLPAAKSLLGLRKRRRLGRSSLEGLPEPLLHVPRRLLDKSLLRGGDHPAHHVPAYRTVEPARNVTPVTVFRHLNPKLLCYLVFETIQGLTSLRHQRPVALLPLSHL